MDGLDADFALAPEHIGMLLAAGLLKDEKVLEFIAEVREREGISPPPGQQELEESLNAYPPEQFAEETTPVAEDASERGLSMRRLGALARTSWRSSCLLRRRHSWSSLPVCSRGSFRWKTLSPLPR